MFKILASIIFLTPWQVLLAPVDLNVPTHRQRSFLISPRPLSQSSNIIQYYAKNHLLYRALHKTEQSEGKDKQENENFFP